MQSTRTNISATAATPAATGEGWQDGVAAGGATAAMPDAGRGADLALLRRMDWRYLLPEQRLQRVLYGGQAEPVLQAALERTCESLTLLPPGESPILAYDVEPRFDLVVLHSPGPRIIEYASRVLRPDGWLYCELDRPGLLRATLSAAQLRGATPSPGGALLLPLDYLHSLGLTGIRRYWHYPDFRSCRWIVPVEPAAVAALLEREGVGGWPAALPGATRWAARTGVLAHVVTHLGVVARKLAAHETQP